MKKTMFIFLTMIIIGTSLSSCVYASSYKTILEMAPDTIWQGEPRRFDAGEYTISLYPTSFYNFAYCDIYIDLYKKDLIGHTFLAGDEEAMSPINQTYTFSRGRHDGCNAYYYFKLVHGGIKADPVYLESH